MQRSTCRQVYAKSCGHVQDGVVSDNTSCASGPLSTYLDAAEAHSQDKQPSVFHPEVAYYLHQSPCNSHTMDCTTSYPFV